MPLCARRTDDEEEEFHKKALITQQAATMLADRFNQEAADLGIENLPKVAYMTSCVVMTGKMEPSADGKPADPDEPESRLLFAERRINGAFRYASTARRAVSALLLSCWPDRHSQEVEYQQW